MGVGAPGRLITSRAAVRAVLAVILGLASPVLVSLVIALLRAQFDFPFLFLYLPGSLFLAYFGGLFAGTISAVVSTLLVLHFSAGADGLSLSTIGRHGLPASLFLLTGTLMAVAGDQYRAYHEQLRRDLAETARRARIEALVVRVTDLLASDADLQRIGQEICAGCAEVFGSICAIVRQGSRAAGLRVEACSSAGGGDHDRTLKRLSQVLTKDAAAFSRGIMKDSNTVVVTRDTLPSVPAELGLWFDGEGLEVATFTTLRAGEERPGFLMVTAREPRRWTPEDTRAVQSIADRIASAIDLRRRIERRLRLDRNNRLITESMADFFRDQPVPELLDRVTHRCVDVLGDWCGIGLIDADAPDVRLAALYHPNEDTARKLVAAYERMPLPRNHPLMARMLDGHAPLVLAAEDPAIRDLVDAYAPLQEVFADLAVREILAVPIVVGGVALGILTAGRESPGEWEAEDLALAADLADRAGAAITNARLFELERRARKNAERETRRLDAVNRLIAIAARSLDFGEAFDEFADALQVLLPFSGASVTLHVPERDALTVPFLKGALSGSSAGAPEGPKAGTARGWVIDTAQGCIRRDTLEEREFEEDRLLASAGIRSYLIVPMTVGSRAVGALSLGHQEAGFYTEEHARLIQPVADHLAVALSHSRLFEQVQRRAGELTEAMQRAMLPAGLPRTPFTAMHALYRPADPDTGIGGDWYDAVLLPDDTLLVSIGDISGRGLPAAAAMGQIRHVIRAYAMERRGPGSILTAVNDYVSRVPDRWHLSVWVGVLDTHDDLLRFANAGHPPALMLGDTETAALEAGGPPLGFAAGTVYRDALVACPPGARLVLYTDGLIDASRDVIDGERRLRETAVAIRYDTPAQAAQALVDGVLRGTEPHDDVAVLIVDMLPSGAPLQVSLPAVPSNLWRIRRAVSTFARRHDAPRETADGMVVAAGEAALNVVEHAYEGRLPGRVLVQGERLGDALIVTVRDFGTWRTPVDRGRGRGTRIMQGFADTVRSTTGPDGTTVVMTWKAVRTGAVAPRS